MNEKFKVLAIEEIISKDYGPELWTIDKLVPQQSITAITGAPASFKTWVTLEIAKSIALGVNFLECFPVTQGNVLVVDKENHLRHIQKRLRMLSLENHPIFYLENPEDFLVTNPEHIKTLLERVIEHDIKVVIFDSLVRMHAGDENEARHMSSVMGVFRKITNKGVTVIFIHHNRKESLSSKSSPNSVRGSSDIYAGVDCLLQITRTQNEKILSITHAKLRQGESVEPFQIRVTTNEDTELISFDYAGSTNPHIIEMEAESDILNALRDGNERSGKELRALFAGKYKPQIVSNALENSVRVGLITKRRGAHNTYFFQLKPSEVEKIPLESGSN